MSIAPSISGGPVLLARPILTITTPTSLPWVDVPALVLGPVPSPLPSGAPVPAEAASAEVVPIAPAASAAAVPLVAVVAPSEVVGRLAEVDVPSAEGAAAVDADPSKAARANPSCSLFYCPTSSN